MTIPHTLDDELASDEKRAAFRVNDDAAAEWAITRLSEIRAEQAAKQRFARLESDRVQLWLESELQPLETRAAYFVNLLEDYARRQREDVDRKSVSLPHGKISTRFSQPKFNINDDLFVPWAAENAPHLLRVKQEPSLTALKLHLLIDEHRLVDQETGAVVVGVAVLPPQLSVTIKTEGEKE